MENYLNQYKERAIQAHNWTSFSPEKRGQQLIDDYNNQLTDDINELTKNGIDIETIESYKGRYERLFSSWLSAKGNCISSMITGPARFPTRKAEKANRSEDNHYKVWQEWRVRAKKAIIRKSLPEKTNESEIERYNKDLNQRKLLQEIMKKSNAIIRASKGSDCTGKLIELGMSESTAIKAQHPDFAGRIGFAQYQLTNNLANIKRIEDRIKELEKKTETAAAGNKTIVYEWGYIVLNYEADRIQVIHHYKPIDTVIQKFKSNGFRWSPSQKAWQRQLTGNGISAVERMFNITINN